MKIHEIASLIQGTVEGNTDSEILGLSGPCGAGPNDLTFAVDENRLASAEESPTVCILTTPSMRKSSKPLIRVANPKLAFLILYEALYKKVPTSSFTHPSAILAPSVKLGQNVHIGSHVTIEDDVVIGDNTIIESNTVIRKGCSIGSLCHIHPNVVLYKDCILKDKVILHGGVVVGSDGFGYVKNKNVIYKFPQLGKVIIENNVEIGSNCTIDRGSMEDTIIGANTKIDNLCHVAHNVKIGTNVLMAGQSGIAGSTIIKDNVTISGQVAITDNVVVGQNTVIGGGSAVIGHLKDNEVVWGNPARPLAQTKRQLAVLAWVTKNFRQLSRMLKDKEGLLSTKE